MASMNSTEHSSMTQNESEYTRDGFMGQEVLETRLVIGLDYGTTFTGVAYATPSGAQCALDQIDVMTDWGPQMDNHDKVPSVISYSRPSQATEQQWGSNLSADAVSMVHTKLELGLQDVLGELDMTLQVLDGMMDLNFDAMMMSRGNQDLPPYSHKSPEAIVTDYLTKVFEWLEQEVEKFGSVLRKHTATDIVVTVPTEWSYMAMNSTFRALSKAGFNQLNFPKLEEVMFITEPEAAALYTARYYRDEKREEFLREREYFILCDAGGGTVDVVSYQVQRLYPSLQLDQVGLPTGEKCGSIFINQKFKEWIRLLLGDEEYRKLDPNLDIGKNASHASETPAMRALMKKFDALKKHFGMDSRDLRLTLPDPVQDLNIPGRVNQGLITIPRKAMENFFDACLIEIVKLIKEHIRRIELRGSRPRNLFLVGGFGESEYLQWQIEDTLKEEGLLMKFRRPHESWTAVVQGAVVCGIEKKGTQNLKRTNSCRHSYAICMDELFNKVHHLDEDAFQRNGTAQARSQLIWLLNKGDLILSDGPRRVEKDIDLKLTKFRQDTLKVPIFRNSSNEEERPTRFGNAQDELELACELVIDLSKIQLERNRPGRIRKFGTDTSYQATIKLVLELDWDVLEASIWWSDMELARSAVKY
ncbi:hypothetical protein P153DRAFT_432314 [Dothidotthia symphoricarpi CBS 119687]|uniref:Actin-like ATPase domain-containing protein n=1 Tax=Dothidotthia symphoricarpi CBS 119687 TaxID=1392245 RepID=A0A6A6A7Q8_9PLEO|nr:uncharacterized protein P153DRAFT_432314 [Dothidotthia symphoricarpi CBS 119687]KAF2127870.1 hypothetical protein P153DRAFT_432314 [Dothidotthia symphoricarpi CBS 119687]